MVYSCHIFIDSMALIVILVEYFERVYVKSSIRACIFKCMFIYLYIQKRRIWKQNVLHKKNWKSWRTC